jgi:hypothetical protein
VVVICFLLPFWALAWIWDLSIRGLLTLFALQDCVQYLNSQPDIWTLAMILSASSPTDVSGNPVQLPNKCRYGMSPAIASFPAAGLVRLLKTSTSLDSQLDPGAFPYRYASWRMKLIRQWHPRPGSVHNPSRRARAHFRFQLVLVLASPVPVRAKTS